LVCSVLPFQLSTRAGFGSSGNLPAAMGAISPHAGTRLGPTPRSQSAFPAKGARQEVGEMRISGVTRGSCRAVSELETMGRERALRSLCHPPAKRNLGNP